MRLIQRRDRIIVKQKIKIFYLKVTFRKFINNDTNEKNIVSVDEEILLDKKQAKIIEPLRI